MKTRIENIISCFIGLAVGDALGVPVEFRSRSTLGRDPVKSMRAFGAWNQPAGTWSDDSSLTFCLAESLLKGYDLNDIGQSFVKWKTAGYWGAHYKVFDIGGTTRGSIDRIQRGEDPLYSGDFDEDSNGNGSLMRIVPASLYFCDVNDDALLERMREISGVTHRHFRSVFSCLIYSKIVAKLFFGLDKMKAYHEAMLEVDTLIQKSSFFQPEIDRFQRVLKGTLVALEEEDISSSGYVLHTLEASLWCFLKTDSYSDAVLKAVNLGEDTDTTGCVTGALAGLYYGMEAIPYEWVEVIARKNDILNLAQSFTDCIRQRILTKS